MKFKNVGWISALAIILAALFIYPLDAYISQPGGAYDLTPLVEVEEGDENDTGTFSLMTISLGKATPATYLMSKVMSTRKLLPVESVRRPGEDDKEYSVRQQKLMSDSQFNAITVAFDKANIPVDVAFDGVFVVNVLKDGAAHGLLEAGDKIRVANGIPLTESGLFFDQIADKEEGDVIEMTLDRDDKSMDVSVKLTVIPDGDGRVGLGVRFQEDRELTTKPKVEMHTAEIGGPSAGLMFTLEIMDQLLDEDMTKGYNIAGTGEMLEDGTVGRIGGADFKVIAADRDGVEIFFAPDDDLPAEVLAKNPHLQTNYEEAVKMGEKIGTKMKIVPVKTVDDALAYLEKLTPR